MTEKFSHTPPDSSADLPEQAPETIFLSPRDWHYEYLFTFRYWLAIAGLLFLPLIVLAVLDVGFGWSTMTLTLVLHPWMVYGAWGVLGLLGITLNVGEVHFYCPDCGARTNHGFDVCQRCGRGTG